MFIIVPNSTSNSVMLNNDSIMVCIYIFLKEKHKGKSQSVTSASQRMQLLSLVVGDLHHTNQLSLSLSLQSFA